MVTQSLHIATSFLSCFESEICQDSGGFFELLVRQTEVSVVLELEVMIAKWAHSSKTPKYLIVLARHRLLKADFARASSEIMIDVMDIILG